MRKFIDLMMSFLKRNKLAAILSLGFPLIMITMTVVFEGSTSNVSTTGVVNLDKGTRAQALIDQFEASDTFEVFDTEEKATKALHEETQQVYIFPENFSTLLDQGEKPEVEILVKNEELTGHSEFNFYLQNTVQMERTNQYLDSLDLAVKEAETPWEIKIEEPLFKGKDIMVIALLSFGILYGGAMLSTDLVSQKKAKVLRRGLATPTSGYMILASSIAGSWVLQFTSNLLALAFVQIFIPFSLKSFLTAVALVAFTCIFSACIQLLILRIFKEPQMSVFVGMILSMIFLFLPMIYDMREIITNVPSFLFKFAYISPIFWIIEATTGGSILLSLGMLLLLSLMLFFAGSIRLKDFAE